MAVTARVFVQVLLMVFLRREKVAELLQLDGELCPCLSLLRPIDGLDLGQLAVIRVIDPRAVLYPPVAALPA